MGFLLLMILISVIAIFVPALSEQLHWFQYSNGLIGIIFLASVYIKVKATLSHEKKSPMGQVALTFFMKMFGLITLLAVVFFVGGKELMAQVKYFILGLFLFYTLAEFVFLQVKK